MQQASPLSMVLSVAATLMPALFARGFVITYRIRLKQIRVIELASKHFLLASCPTWCSGVMSAARQCEETTLLVSSTSASSSSVPSEQSQATLITALQIRGKSSEGLCQWRVSQSIAVYLWKQIRVLQWFSQRIRSTERSDRYSLPQSLEQKHHTRLSRSIPNHLWQSRHLLLSSSSAFSLWSLVTGARDCAYRSRAGMLA